MTDPVEISRNLALIEEWAAALTDRCLEGIGNDDDLDRPAAYKVLLAAACEVSELELVAMADLGAILFSVSDPGFLRVWINQGPPDPH